MSGRDSGTDTPGWDSMPCLRLRFSAQIATPVPTVVWTLHPGDVLNVALANPEGSLVVQVLKDDELAGGLIGGSTARLRDCLQQGNLFKATVERVNGGQVRVLIEAR